jgi:hypothetical protein
MYIVQCNCTIGCKQRDSCHLVRSDEADIWVRLMQVIPPTVTENKFTYFQVLHLSLSNGGKGGKGGTKYVYIYVCVCVYIYCICVYLHIIYNPVLQINWCGGRAFLWSDPRSYKAGDKWYSTPPSVKIHAVSVSRGYPIFSYVLLFLFTSQAW